MHYIYRPFFSLYVYEKGPGYEAILGYIASYTTLSDMHGQQDIDIALKKEKEIYMYI